DTDNIYESVAIIAKRSNQIAAEMKKEIKSKLEEFASYSETIDERYENREQIEISRYYEKLPKPTIIASQEFIDNQIYFRNPQQDSNHYNDR
ncbi:MAG: DNA-directed RNA polymerase subunit omega, partial [Bacteroidaceae bacterium]|nr:DNA-directed RNA polymerase subunit omega [Bacteroidaceae bacterium]